MSENKERYIGESKLNGTPNKKFKFKLGEKVVDTKHLKDNAVTTPKIADGTVTNPKIADGAVSWGKLDHNVQNIINTSGGGGGAGLATEWGDSEELGLTQKFLTEEHEAREAKDAEQDEDIDGLASQLNTKANAADVYNKSEVYTKNETYSKEQINGMIDEPFVTNVSVVSELPSTGEANIIYRVPGENSFTDYGWDGTTFVPLAHSNNGIDDEPTAKSNNLVESGGISNSLYTLKLLGQNDTLVNGYLTRIIPGNYRIYLKNPSIPRDQISYSTSEKIMLIIRSENKEGVRTTLVEYNATTKTQPFESYYDVLIPNDCETLVIAMRANIGESQIFLLQNTSIGIIDKTHLINPVSNSTTDSMDSLQLACKLNGVTATEEKINYDEIVNGKQANYDGTIATNTPYSVGKFEISGFKSLRFLGIIKMGEQGRAGWAFFDENNNFISGSRYENNLDASQHEKHQYEIDVPLNAKWVRTNIQTSIYAVEEFYIYGMTGFSVGDVIKSQGTQIELSGVEQKYQIDANGIYSQTSTTRTKLVPFSQYAGKRIKICYQAPRNITISYLTSNNLVVGEVAPFCKNKFGRTIYYYNENSQYFIDDVPLDCQYILVLTYVSSSDAIREPIIFEYSDNINKAEKEVVLNLEKKPYQKEVRFRVEVETNQPQLPTDESFTIDEHLISKSYIDNCVLYLPDNYKSNGEPTKLIVFCKQGGSKISYEPADDYAQSERGVSPIFSLPIFGYLMSLGYAVMAADGEPDEWLEDLNLGVSTTTTTTIADLRVSGNYVAVQSTKRAYDYVIKNYNIDTKGAFLFGYSQGGQYAQNVLDLSGIPFLAVAEMAPVCSFKYHQWDLASSSATIGNITNCTRSSRLNIARMFGFGDNITTNDELLALNYEDYKQYLVGYDPWTRNVISPFNGFTKVGNLWNFSEDKSVDDVDMIKYAKAPLKIWCAEGDTSLSIDPMKAFIKAIKNGGGVSDITVYPQQANSHRFYEYQQTLGNVTVAGVSYPYTAVALDIAIWFRCFGGY